jgi:hypothetical protein
VERLRDETRHAAPAGIDKSDTGLVTRRLNPEYSHDQV